MWGGAYFGHTYWGANYWGTASEAPVVEGGVGGWPYHWAMVRPSRVEYAPIILLAVRLCDGDILTAAQIDQRVSIPLVAFRATRTQVRHHDRPLPLAVLSHRGLTMVRVGAVREVSRLGLTAHADYTYSRSSDRVLREVGAVVRHDRIQFDVEEEQLLLELLNEE